MPKRRPIIAIDGPAGAGKSTIAKTLARRLGYQFINTGAMYRAVAWKALNDGIPLDDTERIGQLANDSLIELIGIVDEMRVLVDGRDITEAISSPRVSQAASIVSAIPAVRRALVARQQQMGRAGGVVMEGRDIGTQVFPDAEIKIYLDATSDARARRRFEEDQSRGLAVASLDRMKTEIEERDTRDKTRADSPLEQAGDAIYIDSSALTIEQVVERILNLVAQKKANRSMTENEYSAATYGERIAGVYDDWHATVEEDAIATLKLLAGGGPALELGIGTGRVALPLAAQGVAVHGLDASPEMIAQLRAKPGGDAIPVTIGDFADVAVEGEFTLVYIVFNTFFCLLTQEDQLRCFRGVARRLTADGVFLIEAFAPDLSLYPHGQSVRASRISTEHVSLLVAKHDPVEQRVISQQVIITARGAQLFPLQIRYAWPSELDLMARLAGLRLRHRWGGWRREAFTAESSKHVSVYERAEA